jgi:hypothetical protein
MAFFNIPYSFAMSRAFGLPALPFTYFSASNHLRLCEIASRHAPLVATEFDCRIRLFGDLGEQVGRFQDFSAGFCA